MTSEVSVGYQLSLRYAKMRNIHCKHLSDGLKKYDFIEMYYVIMLKLLRNSKYDSYPLQTVDDELCHYGLFFALRNAHISITLSWNGDVIMAGTYLVQNQVEAKLNWHIWRQDCLGKFGHVIQKNDRLYQTATLNWPQWLILEEFQTSFLPSDVTVVRCRSTTEVLKNFFKVSCRSKERSEFIIRRGREIVTYHNVSRKLKAWYWCGTDVVL